MSENLSIDEILKRAQEVREKSSQTIKKTNPTAYGSDDKTRVINVNVSDRKSTRLNSRHVALSRMPSSA